LKEREREILTKAKSLFSLRGFHSLTVSDIVDSLGIARGTFYLYFKSKDEVYKRVLEEVVKELSRCFKLVPKEKPLEQLRENLLQVLKLVERDPEVARLILYHPYRLNRGFDQILEDFFSELLSMVESSLLRGMEMGLVRECNVRLASRAVLGAFLEVIRGFLEGEFEEPQEAVEELLELALNGLLEGK